MKRSTITQLSFKVIYITFFHTLTLGSFGTFDQSLSSFFALQTANGVGGLENIANRRQALRTANRVGEFDSLDHEISTAREKNQNLIREFNFTS